MNKTTKEKRERLRQIIEKGESLLTHENMAEFYIGLTRMGKRNLSLFGLKTLVTAFNGSPQKVVDYLKKLEAPS